MQLRRDSCLQTPRNRKSTRCSFSRDLGSSLSPSVSSRWTRCQCNVQNFHAKPMIFKVLCFAFVCLLTPTANSSLLPPFPPPLYFHRPYSSLCILLVPLFNLLSDSQISLCLIFCYFYPTTADVASVALCYRKFTYSILGASSGIFVHMWTVLACACVPVKLFFEFIFSQEALDTLPLSLLLIEVVTSLL